MNYDPLYLVITGLAMLLSQLVGTQMKRFAHLLADSL